MSSAARITDIIRHVRKFGYRETLGVIHQLAVSLNDEPGRAKQLGWPRPIGRYVTRQKVVVSTHSLAALTKVILAHGNQWETASPPVKEVVLLQNHVDHLPNHFTTDPDWAVSPLDQVFFQLSCQQFPFQISNAWDDIGRTLTIFREVPNVLKREQFTPPFDLDALFQDISGMSLAQFLWTGFFLFSLAVQRSYLKMPPSPDYLEKIRQDWRGHPDDMPTRESFEHFLAMTAKDMEGFKATIGDLRKVDQRLIKFDYWPLVAYPIVRTRADEVVVPIPKLLMDRITHGVFHDFANAVRGSGQENPFRSYFGHLFERYVGLQLSLVFPGADLYQERDYGADGWKTPDWVVNHALATIALECRSSTFAFSTRSRADWEDIVRDLRRIAIDTLDRLGRKVEDLQAGKTGIPLSSKGTIAALCTWEVLHPLGLFGGLLRSQAKPGWCDFHVVPITYLERLCATEDAQTFMSALEQLKVDEHWQNPLDEGPENRLRRALPDKPVRNAILNRATQEFFAALPGDDEGRARR